MGRRRKAQAYSGAEGERIFLTRSVREISHSLAQIVGG